MHYKRLTAGNVNRGNPDELLRNNADSSPEYIFFVTNDLSLEYFLVSLIGYQNFKNHPVFHTGVVPSSSLVIEVTEDSEGQLNIEAFFNDVSLVLAGCGKRVRCSVSNFV